MIFLLESTFVFVEESTSEQSRFLESNMKKSIRLFLLNAKKLVSGIKMNQPN
ncbi:unnamed protein product [Brassica rapa subsp. trilocularis]